MDQKQVNSYIARKYGLAVFFIGILIIAGFLVQNHYMQRIGDISDRISRHGKAVHRLNALAGTPASIDSFLLMSRDSSRQNTVYLSYFAPAIGRGDTLGAKDFRYALAGAVDSLQIAHAAKMALENDLQRAQLVITLLLLLALHVLVVVVFRPMRRSLARAVLRLIKQRDKANTASHSKSEFLSAIGHEIRTSLNGVIGMTGLVLDTALSEDQRNNLKQVKKSGENLNAVIENILDYAQIEAGRIKLDEMYFSLPELIKKVITTQRDIATEKGLDLLHIVEPDVPSLVNGDVARLEKILDKLLDNAIRYTRKGEVLLRIYVVWKKDKKCSLQFLVSDSGPGIPASRLPHLFDPFTRVAERGEHRFGGSGLGMAIAGQLVQKMGGRIWVESEMSRGTTVYMQIPFGIDAHAAHVFDPQKRELLRNRHLLIVDDSPSRRRQLSVQCNAWGMYPEGVAGMAQARMFLTQNKTDVILLSRHLENGSLGSFANGTPVITYSANTENGTAPLSQNWLYESFIDAFGRQNGISKNGNGQNATKTLRILLAEDNSVNRRLVQQLIAKMGFRIDVAENGGEAVEKAMNSFYDIIFMDLQMPELDGIEATRHILSGCANYGFPAPRIIAMTANAEQRDKEMCFDAGMVDYLSKPIDVEKLRLTLQHWSSVINA